MSVIFKNFFIYENEVFFYVVCGLILSIMISCFALGYIEVKKGESNADK